MYSNPFSSIGYDLCNLENKIDRKADSYELTQTNNNVNSLEHSLRELSSEVTRIRDELQTAKEELCRLTEIINANIEIH